MAKFLHSDSLRYKFNWNFLFTFSSILVGKLLAFKVTEISKFNEFQGEKIKAQVNYQGKSENTVVKICKNQHLI